MMKNYFVYFLTILLLLVTTGLSYAGVGTTGAEFLRINPDARIVSLGETYAALSTVGNVTCANPATLANLKQRSLNTTHVEWFSDVQNETIYYGQPLLNNWAIGVGLVYLHMAKIQKRDINGKLTNDSYQVYDSAVNCGLAKKIRDFLWAGVNIKIIQSKLTDKKAQSYAADLGIVWRDSMGKLAVGAVVQNFGTEVKFGQESDSLPLSLRIGVAYHLLEERNLLLVFDIDSYLEDKKINFHIGSEYWFSSLFAFRLGYKTNTIDISTLSGLSVGIGIDKKNVGVAYAFVPYGELGNAHRFSLGFKF